MLQKCIYVYSDIYNVDVANILQSTGKVLRSVTFILVAIFLSLVREKATKKLRKSHESPFVVVLNITLCSLYVNISFRTTASDKRQE